MTIYHTAYQTTACADFRMESTVNAVLEAKVRDPLIVADGVAYVDASNGAQGEIKAFRHALYIQKHTSAKDWHGAAQTNPLDPFLAMDVRPAGRFDAQSGAFKITNATMYKHMVMRAALSSVWLSSGPNAFRQITPVATSIFASWIAEAIGFRYNLDPKTRIDLMILAGIFYQSNHIDGIEFDKGNEARYLAAIANALKINIAEVGRIYAQTKAIGSIEDFCQKAKTVAGNVRLENLNAGVLISLMGATWAGDNRVEITAVAMEHPPTWIALLYEALTNAALKKVGLSKIVERRQYAEGLERLGQVLKSVANESTTLVERMTRP